MLVAAKYNENPEVVQTLIYARAKITKKQKEVILDEIFNNRKLFALSENEKKIYT